MTGQMIYNPETDRYELDGYGLHCGECLQVLLYDAQTNSVGWRETRIEKASDWFLVGLKGYRLDGLFACYGNDYKAAHNAAYLGMIDQGIEQIK